MKMKCCSHSGLLPVATACMICFVAPFVAAGTIQFAHDAAGRLVSAHYGAQQALTYAYDAAGNLIRVGPPQDSGDLDGDGMADSWELQYFNTRSRDGSGDFDGDGASDLGEFLAGTLPDNPASALLLLREVTAAGVATTVRWQSVAGRTYRVQFKNSLNEAAWQDLSGDVTASGAITSKIDSSSAAQPSRLYRVRLVN